MNILFDAQIFRQQRYGGISRYFCELAARLARAPAVTARIVAPHHRNAYLSELPPSVVVGWPAERWKRLGKLSRLAARVVERRATAQWPPDVIHETYYWGPLLKHPGALRVLTVYDMIHERFPQHFSADEPTARAKRDAVARADHIICISENTRRDLIEMLGVPAAKVSVTHLSANMAAPQQSGTVAGRDDGTRAPPYFLYVGERGGYKNFMGLVGAVAASPQLAGFCIACFGGGALSAEEWQRIEATGMARERIAHHSGDDGLLARLYSGAFCFVYPSLYEGFGIPPLEAMQCGCPVACSGTSSMPEVVGEAGAYFDPQDIDSMRQTLERVASDDTWRAQLRQRGHEQAARFSWERCAEQTLALYRRLHGNTAPAATMKASHA